MAMFDGLLGSSWDDPKTTGLLALAANLSSGQRFMPALAQGLLGRQQIISQGEEAASRRQMRDFQMQEMQEAMAQRARQQEFIKNIPSPQMLASQTALAGGGGPTVANAAKMRQVPPEQQMLHGALQAGLMSPLDYISALTPKKAKIKEFKEVRGADGNVSIVGLDEYGQPVQTGQTPFKDAQEMDLGGVKVLRDPTTGKIVQSYKKTLSPDAAAANALGWANHNLSRERNSAEFGGVVYEKDSAGNIVALPKRPTMAGPIQAIPVGGTANAAQKDANEALAVIGQAKELIPKATSSAIGAGVDAIQGYFGGSNDAANNAAKLKALEGALVARMPKMSGPQSDKDVAMYKQMAAEIGNPTTPAARRLAALEEVERIQRRYAGMPASPQGASSIKFLGFEK